jgi:hypothetical protein
MMIFDFPSVAALIHFQAGELVKLTSCKGAPPGQQFDYQYTGLWYPVGPLVNIETGLCLTPAVPGDKDWTAIKLQPCDRSCQQLWLVNGRAMSSFYPTPPHFHRFLYMYL